jgi:hypothetical protein
MAERRASVSDIHDIAAGMPHTTRIEGPKGNAIYQVGGKSFVFFRNPRSDARDPVSGEPYPDVIVIWVDSDAEKKALVQDPRSPFFTTPHFNDHLSVLVRESELHRLGRDELAELIQDAWVSRASARRGAAWLAQRGLDR